MNIETPPFGKKTNSKKNTISFERAVSKCTDSNRQAEQSHLPEELQFKRKRRAKITRACNFETVTKRKKHHPGR